MWHRRLALAILMFVSTAYDGAASPLDRDALLRRVIAQRRPQTTRAASNASDHPIATAFAGGVTPGAGSWAADLRAPTPNGNVTSITYWDGSLVIGGWFTAIGDQPARGVARWDGARWQPIGSTYPSVSLLDVWQGNLIASVGGALRRWNGSDWMPIVIGDASAVLPSDSDLVVAGYLYDYPVTADYRVGRLTGSTEEWLGGPLAIYPYALASFDGAVFLGGEQQVDDTTGAVLQRWDGAAWQPFGHFEQHDQRPMVLTMASFGSELLVGGLFDGVDGVPANGLARWNGSTWSAVPGAPLANVVAITMKAAPDGVYLGGMWGDHTGLARYDGVTFIDVPGPDLPFELAADSTRLAAAGPFDDVEGRVMLQVAERESGSWHSFETWEPPMRGLGGIGFTDVQQLLAFDGDVVARGNFNAAADDTGWVRVHNVASWDGAHWHPLGNPGNAGELVVNAGDLYLISSGAQRWTGADWEWQGAPLPGAFFGASVAGSLYAGTVGWPGGPNGDVWRWDAPDWSRLPHPADIPDTASVMEMIADGSRLVVRWQWAEGNRITRWDGSWTTISGMLHDYVGPLATWNGYLLAANFSMFSPDSTLMVEDNGTWHSTGITGRVDAMTDLGSSLVVSGLFNLSTGPYVTGARWDGAHWYALPWLSVRASTLLGIGNSLWMGGRAADNGPLGSIARWDDVIPAPRSSAFISATPNPFNTSVALNFTLAHGSTVRAAILDVTGHEVTRLWNGFLAGGDHTMTWDGTDRHGRRVASGVYFARLVVDDQTTKSQRIALIR